MTHESTEWEPFKLQRPLMTNGTDPMILIYNEDRSIMAELPVSDEILEIFGEEFKIYHTCRIIDTELEIGDPCEPF